MPVGITILCAVIIAVLISERVSDWTSDDASFAVALVSSERCAIVDSERVAICSALIESQLISFSVALISTLVSAFLISERVSDWPSDDASFAVAFVSSERCAIVDT